MTVGDLIHMMKLNEKDNVRHFSMGGVVPPKIKFNNNGNRHEFCHTYQIDKTKKNKLCVDCVRHRKDDLFTKSACDNSCRGRKDIVVHSTKMYHDRHFQHSNVLLYEREIYMLETGQIDQCDNGSRLLHRNMLMFLRNKLLEHTLNEASVDTQNNGWWSRESTEGTKLKIRDIKKTLDEVVDIRGEVSLALDQIVTDLRFLEDLYKNTNDVTLPNKIYETKQLYHTTNLSYQEVGLKYQQLEKEYNRFLALDKKIELAINMYNKNKEIFLNATNYLNN